MNTKQIKFYQLYEKLCKFDYMSDITIVAKFFDNVLALDFGYATEMWEYFSTVYESAITKDTKLSKFFSDDLLNTFYKADSKKAIKLILENGVISSAIYQFGTLDSIAFDYLIELLVTSKVEYADYLLKFVIKNNNLDFGPIFKKVVTKMLDDITAKTKQPPKINRKMDAMLTGYINKIKTDEKSLLKQRLLELS